jgi:hypothetical protein
VLTMLAAKLIHPRHGRCSTNRISPEALKSLNDGFVVAITLEAKEGQADASFSANFFSPSTLNVTARECGPRTAQLFTSAWPRTAAPTAPPR